jgi:hypothetical protein
LSFFVVHFLKDLGVPIAIGITGCSLNLFLPLAKWQEQKKDIASILNAKLGGKNSLVNYKTSILNSKV